MFTVQIILKFGNYSAGKSHKTSEKQMIATDSQIELYDILKHWFIICESVAFFNEISAE